MAEVAIFAIAIGALGGLTGAYAAASPDAFGVAEKSISDTAGKSAPEKKKSAKLTTVSVMCLLAVLRESEREREWGDTDHFSCFPGIPSGGHI
jgi:hypothetical protein